MTFEALVNQDTVGYWEWLVDRCDVTETFYWLPTCCHCEVMLVIVASKQVYSSWFEGILVVNIWFYYLLKIVSSISWLHSKYALIILKKIITFSVQASFSSSSTKLQKVCSSGGKTSLPALEWTFRETLPND